MTDTTLSEPKKLAALVAAGIATLIGLPDLLIMIDPALTRIVYRQYPVMGDLVYGVIYCGTYVLTFSVLQSAFSLALGSVATAVALRLAL